MARRRAVLQAVCAVVIIIAGVTNPTVAPPTRFWAVLLAGTLFLMGRQPGQAVTIPVFAIGFLFLTFRAASWMVAVPWVERGGWTLAFRPGVLAMAGACVHQAFSRPPLKLQISQVWRNTIALLVVVLAVCLGFGFLALRSRYTLDPRVLQTALLHLFLLLASTVVFDGLCDDKGPTRTVQWCVIGGLAATMCSSIWN